MQVYISINLYIIYRTDRPNKQVQDSTYPTSRYIDRNLTLLSLHQASFPAH